MLVLFARHQILLLRMYTIVGIVQVVVAHALDSSYPKDQVLAWKMQADEFLHKASEQKRSHDNLVL